MNRAPINFLLHIYDGSIEHLTAIFNADVEEDKETIKTYLTSVKEKIEEWIKEL